MDVIVHKFQKNSSIRFKNSFCQFSNFEAKKSILPVNIIRDDHIRFKSHQKYSTLAQRKYTQTYSFNLSLFSSKIDPFDHQKPMLCIFKIKNHVSFVDQHAINYLNSNFEAILRFRFFPCFPQCVVLRSRRNRSYSYAFVLNPTVDISQCPLRVETLVLCYNYFYTKVCCCNQWGFFSKQPRNPKAVT